MCARNKVVIPITRWLVAIWCCFIAVDASAQIVEVGSEGDRAYVINVNIFNRYDDDAIDWEYMGNSEVFAMLDSLMQDEGIVGNTQQINVVSSSSIEGSVAYNTRLSRDRMVSIEKEFRARYYFIADSVWNFSYVPENWEHLRRAVAQDDRVPNRDKVLEIIDSDEYHADMREHFLKMLDDGVSWSYIHARILPSSRGSVSMLFVPKIEAKVSGVEPLASYVAAEKPTAQVAYSAPKSDISLISIRTNLLLDITTTLNLSVEIPLSPRLSISAEYINPWWKNWENSFTWQIQSLYFDFRYWFGSRGDYNTLTGLSLGVYAGSGMYDLQPFSADGVQGEYSDYGLTLSYAHRLGKSKRWLMEYTVGLGYLTTHYRHYYAEAQTDEYGNVKVHNYPWSEETLISPMPTRLGVTLAYTINWKGGSR